MQKTDPQKRALIFSDLSAVGRCSLTAALPIVSALGIEASALPSALLSTQTGGFSDYFRRDLSAEIPPILAHWKSIALSFDGIYTGYFAAKKQIDLAERVFSEFPAPLRVIDPVMADGGDFYGGFDRGWLPRMRRLAARADVLLPNLTEASLLAGVPYRENAGEKETRRIADKLLALGAANVVIKGFDADGKLGILVKGEKDDKIVAIRREPGFYHGAGDVFGSVLFGKLLCGETLAAAAECAAEFVARCISLTRKAGTDLRFGLRFEPLLGTLSARPKR